MTQDKTTNEIITEVRGRYECCETLPETDADWLMRELGITPADAITILEEENLHLCGVCEMYVDESLLIIDHNTEYDNVCENCLDDVRPESKPVEEYPITQRDRDGKICGVYADLLKKKDDKK